MHAVGRSTGRRSVARLGGLAAGLLVALGAPAVVAAHNLGTVYQSPLPLAVYLAGAATTVALSFVFVLARDMRAAPTPPGRVVHVPAALRTVLRVVGLIGWVWIVAQGIAGGTSEASVATLFLWVYGWVGVAILSALLAPVWEWVNPFATIYDVLAWALRTLGIRGWGITELPAVVRVWPAVVGLMFFIWLELVAIAGNGTLTVVLVGYTVLTLALMAQFGRDQWLAAGETFTVWFRTLNRLAIYGIVPAATTAEARGVAVDDEDPDALDRSAVLRRPFASGLLDATWEIPRVALVALGTASIIFDGLSQTVAFATLFGNPALVQKTVLLIVFLWVIAGTALVVGRAVSWGAIGAGLTPIAVGYLVAHYLTYLLDRRPADHRRGLRPAADRRRPDRHRVLHTDGVHGARPGVDRAAGGGRRRSRARRVGGPRDRPAGRGGDEPGEAAARHAPPKDPRHLEPADPECPAARDPARRDHGRAHDADAVVAGPVHRPGGAGSGRAGRADRRRARQVIGRRLIPRPRDPA